MKVPFEDFDEDQLEENKDEVLSFPEKAILHLAVAFAKLLIWRAKRVKTYGDIYKVVKWFQKNGEVMVHRWEDKYPKNKEHDETSSAEVEEILQDLTRLKNDFEKDNGIEEFNPYLH